MQHRRKLSHTASYGACMIWRLHYRPCIAQRTHTRDSDQLTLQQHVIRTIQQHASTGILLNRAQPTCSIAAAHALEQQPLCTPSDPSRAQVAREVACCWQSALEICVARGAKVPIKESVLYWDAGHCTFATGQPGAAGASSSRCKQATGQQKPALMPVTSGRQMTMTESQTAAVYHSCSRQIPNISASSHPCMLQRGAAVTQSLQQLSPQNRLGQRRLPIVRAVCCMEHA